MIQETSSARSLSSRIVDTVATLAAAAVGLALVFAAFTQLARPVAIEPLASRVTTPLTVSPRALPPRPLPAPVRAGRLAWTRSGASRPAAVSSGLRHDGRPAAYPQQRELHVAARGHGAPPGSVRRATSLPGAVKAVPLRAARAAPLRVPGAARVAVAPAFVRVGVAGPRRGSVAASVRRLPADLRPAPHDAARRVAVASTRLAAPHRYGAYRKPVALGAAALATPEPPLGFDPRPEFVAANVDAGNAANVSLDGLRVRGHALQPPAPLPPAAAGGKP